MDGQSVRMARTSKGRTGSLATDICVTMVGSYALRSPLVPDDGIETDITVRN
jgi:hypothetical protein